ncbi:AAA family ATPase [candidate division KSB3 bacterium]|jgi:CO dehydrogenase maturation factor|uniref:AAA family ATPase n=1 Tax=candidate division KSB3 bacterium TaxID=2044937 RepID=A0A9D5JYI1_9BACT|nr:AAA family ATPase [candidate division KSB3 bacterium]MBD3326612.1 AAA family ATPase [candidate division KSB3 bacterium]
MARSIAVAGKGGTGKTTVAALLVLNLLKQGQGPVLAVDADADANLGSLLGVEPHQSIGDLREEVLKEIKNFPAGMSKASYVEAGLHEIIEEANGFDLVTMGRGEGSGCYCYLNTLIKKFSDDLTPSYPWVVIDNEAGLEHISRRTSTNIDTLLVIVSDNPLSLSSAKKIQDLTDTLEKRISQRYLVTNMIKDDRIAVVQQRLSEFHLDYLCNIPYDPQLEDIVFHGEPLSQLTDGPAIEAITLILDTIGGTHANS